MKSSSKKLSYNKARYYQRKKLGLCVQCSNQVCEESPIRCKKHHKAFQAKLKQRGKQRRLDLIAKGLCAQCGMRPIDPERSKVSCSICLDAAKLKWRERKDTPVYRKMRSTYARYHRDTVRLEVFNAYGGPQCACCNENEIRFLEMDHVNNDGATHRRKIKETGSAWIYYWLKRNGYPEGFQVLCANCNMGKHRCGGICPHKL